MISEKILQPRLAEIGRIKIGGLDENVRTTAQGVKWQAPKKFDYFVLTTMERDQTGNFSRDASLQKAVGEKPTELEIVLMYHDINLNFRTELACYEGKTPVCRGDGEAAQRLNKQTGELTAVACPCDQLGKKCKPHGTLNCLLRKQEIAGGVWKFSTTSWNTIRNIHGSLKFIHLCTGGKLAGLPLKMKYMKKATYTADGKPTTIGTVGLFYEGNPVQMLEAAMAHERKRIEAGIKMELLEQDVRREMISLPAPSVLDEEEVPEFHPIEEVEDAIPAANVADALARKSVPVVEPTPEPVPEPETVPTIDRAATIAEIMDLRAKHRILDGAFLAYLSKAIGRAEKNSDKWTDQEVIKVRDHITAVKGVPM